MATFAHQPGQPQRRRIALLHGTAGSEKTLRIQLGPLLPKLQETWDVTFVEGPKRCAEDNPHVKTMRRFYGPSAELREYAEATADDRGWRTYNELDEAVEALEGRVAGADCLLGFSQGANFASMLAARAERRGTPYRAVVLFVVRGRAGRANCLASLRRRSKRRPSSGRAGRTQSSETATIWRRCSRARSAGRTPRATGRCPRRTRPPTRIRSRGSWIGTGAPTGRVLRWRRLLRKRAFLRQSTRGRRVARPNNAIPPSQREPRAPPRVRRLARTSQIFHRPLSTRRARSRSRTES